MPGVDRGKSRRSLQKLTYRYFGEFKASKADGKRKTLYFILFTLKYSRYKFVEWQSRKFNSEQAIQAHLHAFEYFGGIPREAVYDQDRVFVHTESNGFVRFTRAFKAFTESMPFKVIVANKADPQTKGAVEKYVNFVKDNFARGKKFETIEQWQADALSWLERTGNGKICQAIDETPAECFKREEQQALIPLSKSSTDFNTSVILPYKVNRDNTITFGKSRYRVPNGTYNRCSEHKVGVKKEQDTLVILDLETGEMLATHAINYGKPGVVGEKEAKPLKPEDRSFLITMCASLIGFESGIEYLRHVCETFPRHYIRQLKELNTVLRENQHLSHRTIENVFKRCINEGLFAAEQFREVLEVYGRLENQESFNPSELKIQIRQLSQEELEELNGYMELVLQDTALNSSDRLEKIFEWVEQKLEPADVFPEPAGICPQQEPGDSEHEALNRRRLEALDKLK